MVLNYKKYGEQGPVILILHGLLGSLDNWQTIALQLAAHFQVYSLDMRNHGRSPHATEMSYEVMTQDIVEFCQQQQIGKATLIGHSMGGKVAMWTALQHPEIIDKLIVVDIAPVRYDGGHESILFAMAEAPLAVYSSRSEVEQFIAPRIPEEGVRQFILKNLGRNQDGKFIWKSNLPVLIATYRVLMDFPVSSAVFQGPAYFIQGEKSAYIQAENKVQCMALFPHGEFHSIAGAGHWVHADQPQAFVETLNTILR